MNATSNSLQQSLVQSIQQSRNSRNSNSLLSESINSETMQVSKTFVKTQNMERSTIFISNQSQVENSQWLSLCNQMRSEFSHYFFEIQQLLDMIKENIYKIEYREVKQIAEKIGSLCQIISSMVQLNQMYLYQALIKQVQMFQEFIESIQINLGIISKRGAMNEIDHLSLQENFQSLQEVFSIFAIEHLCGQPIEQNFDEEDEDIDIECSSISSDFSDDDQEVEDFEASTAINVMKLIKRQLRDEEIFDATKYYNFNLQQGQLDLKDFFRSVIQLHQINDYEIQCFICYSGLYLKTLSSKKRQSKDMLESFIVNLQSLINRILQSTMLQLQELIDQNSFGLECQQISKRMFFSRKNLLNKLFYGVLSQKISKWKSIHLTDQSAVIQFEQEMSRSTDKKHYRQLSQRWNIPLNKLEIKVLSWDQGQLFNGSSNSSQILSNFDNSKKVQSLILKLYSDMNDLLSYFTQQDQALLGMLEFKEFFKALKSAALPITAKEAFKTFQQFEEIQGSMSLKGVKVRRLINYQNFTHKMFGIDLNLSMSQSQQENQVNILNKYSPQITYNILVKNMSYKNNELLDQQNSLRQKLRSQEQKMSLMQEQLDSKEYQIQDINQQKDMSTIQIQDIQRYKELENIENIQNFSNINQNVLNGYKFKESQWIKERSEHIRELNQKDKQIQQYRIELEGLVNEMKHVRTTRQSTF